MYCMCVSAIIYSSKSLTHKQRQLFMLFMIIICALVLLASFPSLWFFPLFLSLWPFYNTFQYNYEPKHKASEKTHKWHICSCHHSSPYLSFHVSTQHTQDGFKPSCKMLHFKMFHPWLPFAFVSRCIIFGVINLRFS